MIDWPAARARRVLAALPRIGWRVQRQRGSHRILVKEGQPTFVFAFHDGDEIGPECLPGLPGTQACLRKIFNSLYLVPTA